MLSGMPIQRSRAKPEPRETRGKKEKNDTFRLFDLRVEVEQAEGRPMICNHKVGDSLMLRGENLALPPGQTFPLYSLAALLPLLPAKQRDTHPHDWMTTDALVACPDPHCGGRFRIVRTNVSVFHHADVTAVPLPRKKVRRPRAH